MAEDNRKGRSPRFSRCPGCGALIGERVTTGRDLCPFCSTPLNESKENK